MNKSRVRRRIVSRGGRGRTLLPSSSSATSSFIVIVSTTLMISTIAQMPSSSFVSAFVGFDRIMCASVLPSFLSSSSSWSTSSFGIFANRDSSSSSSSSSSSDPSTAPPTTETTKKLVIPTITDENSHILLRPSEHPNRPILIDAFAPWCGPCKLLDKVLRKAQPRYVDSVDFCRWNVNDVDGTAGLRALLVERGYNLSKLPSLVVFRDGAPIAMRPGFSNEYQLDDFLERTLPDVLDRTFDERGVKMIPMTTTTTTTTSTTTSAKINVVEDVGGSTATTARTAEVPPLSPMTSKTTIAESNTSATATTSASRLEVREDCLVIDVDDEGAVVEERCEMVVVEAATAAAAAEEDVDCVNERECYERLEMIVWKDRIVVPAMDGIGSFLPSRAKAKG